MRADPRTNGHDPAPDGVELAVEPPVDEAQRAALAQALGRAGLIPGEPEVLSSLWWRAGLAHATGRLP